MGRGIDVLPVSRPGDVTSGHFYPAGPSCQGGNVIAVPGTSQVVSAEHCPRGIVLAYFDLKTATTTKRVAVTGPCVLPGVARILVGLAVDGSGRHVIGECYSQTGPDKDPVFVVRGSHTVVIGHAGLAFYGWY